MIDKYLEERPWGNFEQFCKNSVSTIKIINVQPNSKLSLQFHNKRDEFWKILSGKGEVVIGENTFEANEGNEFAIPVRQLHRIQTKDYPLKILEISFGDFDENDIVRLEDDYGRK